MEKITINGRSLNDKEVEVLIRALCTLERFIRHDSQLDYDQRVLDKIFVYLKKDKLKLKS